MDTVTFIEQNKTEQYKQQYKQEFHNYFFAADTAQRFFSFWSNEAQKNPKLIVSKDPEYTSYMLSSQNLIDSCKNYFSPHATCVIEPLSPEWSYFAGFDDGSILIEGINGYQHVFNTIHQAPVSALAQGKGTFSNTTYQPFILIGYKDGTIAFANKNHSKILPAPNIKKTITAIAQGPVDCSWITVEDNNISIYKESHNNPLLYQKKPGLFMQTSLPLINPSPSTIQGLGMYHNAITIYLNDNRTVLWLPYSKSEFDTLYNLDFSSEQIKSIHRIIQRHTKKEHIPEKTFTPTSSSIQFKELPDLVKQIICLKTAVLLEIKYN
jgi:hypothetical protein